MTLSKIQAELKAPKNQYNSFGKYSYRSCEDILEAVKPLLAKEDCSLIISDEIVNIGDRYYVKALSAIIDSTGKVIASSTAYAREAETKKGMDESQITGATSSYARKYSLNGLFAIDDTKDADTKKPIDTVNEVFPGSVEVTPTWFKSELSKTKVGPNKKKVWNKYWKLVKPMCNEDELKEFKKISDELFSA